MPGTSYLGLSVRTWLTLSASPLGDLTRETQAHAKFMNICVYDAGN